MTTADFLVIGGGVAGLSAAAALARHGRVAVIEAEEAIGYHSSGRSATFCHYGIGNETVRGLTACSRSFFLAESLGRLTPALFVATEDMAGALDRLHEAMAHFSGRLERLDAAQIAALVPILRTGDGAVVGGVLDPDGIKLDADALLQAYARAVRSGGGAIALGRRVAAIERNGPGWIVRDLQGEAWSAPVLVNAAGAWADEIAALAGVRRLGLQPKRRTIITVDPPPGCDVGGWPFVKTAVDDFYFLPEAGKFVASPVDEIESEPTDCRPEEYDIAVAAAKVEQYTTIEMKRIAHSWAGLRTFTADRVPTAGFAPDAPGFFWLAGQGGYGLQTAPAMAAIVEALVIGGAWPAELAALGVTADKIRPERLFAQPKHSPSVRTA